jgi:hypothetical protein
LIEHRLIAPRFPRFGGGFVDRLAGAELGEHAAAAPGACGR